MSDVTSPSALQGVSPPVSLPILIACLVCGLTLGQYIVRTWSSRLHPRGCRHLHLEDRSNLSDEFSAVLKPSSKEEWRVKSLWIFPVKSCGGIELSEAQVTASGLQYDRLFCLARKRPSAKGSAEWFFLTQRENARLAFLETELWIPDPNVASYSSSLSEVQSSGVLVIKYPTLLGRGKLLKLVDAFLRRWGLPIPLSSFWVPLVPTIDQLSQRRYDEKAVEIWRDNPMALDMSEYLPSRLRSVLEVSAELGLFRISPERPHERIVLRNAPRKEQLGYQPTVQFGDAFPISLQNLSSVQAVAAWPSIQAKVPKLSAIRFRGNIVISGPEAYDEEDWKLVSIGDEVYHVACRCTRCLLPNNNPSTGIRTNEPYNSMLKFRAIDRGADGKPCLGMQLVPDRAGGVIRVGDNIEVKGRGDHLYQKLLS